MGASATTISVLLGLLTVEGLCQTIPQASLPDDPLASRSLKISGVPNVEPPARDYQRFFDEVQYLGKQPLSAEARMTLHLTDQELRSLITITADLATESEFFQKQVKPWVFESRMEAADSGSVSPSLQEKLHADTGSVTPRSSTMPDASKPPLERNASRRWMILSIRANPCLTSLLLRCRMRLPGRNRTDRRSFTGS